ncbi:MAG: helix-turn-helix domain-containing protein [Methanocellales archaeon]|nr:helix-turn-helix domain-containing protein [Methanocellales archaeon]MDD3292105.1 helix-turn-helix domain-containing protein [Methanocellales archaeon]MDD5235342.1 helix-turn-helix domain-containing protein [Methanocellales archaeon]MDD5485710.1 helix-turn-helix domain-containing protein [Methanocellales archaeon]
MEKGFWAIPKSIAKRKDLSFKAKLITGILWTRKNSDFEAFPSRNYMANALGVSTDTIDRGIRELKEKAGLKVKREGLKRNNRYFFPDWDESAELPNSDSATLPTQESAALPTPIVRESNKDNTVVDESSSLVKEIISHFKSKVKEVKGYDPEISWAKESWLVKQRLAKYEPEKLKELISWYLSSKHSERLGDSLAVCLSTNIINLWKASKASIPYYYR